MWQLLICVLSRPVIKAVSLLTARTTVAVWRARAFPRDSSMNHELKCMQDRLESMSNNTGIVGLINPHGTVCAIATFEAPRDPSASGKLVFVSDIACGDYISGSTLVRTITRTPGVGCASELPERWRIAHAYFGSSFI